MTLSIIVGGISTEEVSVRNFSNYDLGCLIRELFDKNGSNAVIALSDPDEVDVEPAQELSVAE